MKCFELWFDVESINFTTSKKSMTLVNSCGLM